MHPVVKLVAQRFALGLLLLVAASVLIFVGTQILPGDVAQAILGQQATPTALANLRAQMGLDQPAYIRYFQWLFGVLHGDLGKSLANGQDMASEIARAAGQHAVPRRHGGGDRGAAGDHPRPDLGALPRALARQADHRR